MENALPASAVVPPVTLLRPNKRILARCWVVWSDDIVDNPVVVVHGWTRDAVLLDVAHPVDLVQYPVWMPAQHVTRLDPSDE